MVADLLVCEAATDGRWFWGGWTGLVFVVLVAALVAGGDGGIFAVALLVVSVALSLLVLVGLRGGGVFIVDAVSVEGEQLAQ